MSASYDVHTQLHMEREAKMDTETKQSVTGWGNPAPFRSNSKFHYFGADARSLCRKWGNFMNRITLEEGQDDHPDNCVQCKRIRAKQPSAKAEETQ